MRKNPIVVGKRGRRATSSMGGMPLESSDHYVIEAQKDGKVYGTAHVLLDDEGVAGLELLEVSPELRGQASVIVPLIRRAFTLAKELGAEQLMAEACHRRIYEVLLRFKPDYIKTNKAYMDKAGYKTWQRDNGINVLLEDLPKADKVHVYACASDARETAEYGTPEDRAVIKKGGFFTDSRSLYMWTKTMAEDNKVGVVKIANIGLDDGEYVQLKNDVDPKEFGKHLMETSPLDANMNLEKVPMLKMWWFL
jgi:hypothetical protein